MNTERTLRAAREALADAHGEIAAAIPDRTCPNTPGVPAFGRGRVVEQALDRVQCPRASAREIAESVLDPELPVLTLADLGVLREVRQDGQRVTVTVTPTYSGCPAMDEMRSDLRARLEAAGYGPVEVRTVLHPAWTTDWISEDGLRKLREHGIAPPSRIGPKAAGPVPLNLEPPSRRVPCPRCGSARTTELSRFGATACKALRRCEDCREPFEQIKEL